MQVLVLFLFGILLCSVETRRLHSVGTSRRPPTQTLPQDDPDCCSTTAEERTSPLVRVSESIAEASNLAFFRKTPIDANFVALLAEMGYKDEDSARDSSLQMEKEVPHAGMTRFFGSLFHGVV
jgi:hypothetical protein